MPSNPRIKRFTANAGGGSSQPYLTGLEGIEAWQSALVLAPDAETYREFLYTSQDPEEIVEKTGIELEGSDPLASRSSHRNAHSSAIASPHGHLLMGLGGRLRRP